jgi:hypothetical protein
MARPPGPVAASSNKRATKHSLVLDLLRGEGGVALATIVVGTGWQAHSARAALTGLRKQGHVIERCNIDGKT